MTAGIFNATPCDLGEGPLWHPLREQLFWFDILNCRLFASDGTETRHWQFSEMVSAAGWVDESELLIASERRLFLFDLEAETDRDLVSLEADNPATRSNDGRADPWGGFWIGTMGKSAEQGAGAIYRYYRGEVRRLVDAVSIPNSIAFAPHRGHAWFTDTATAKIMRQPLDAGTGWPDGPPEVWRDLASEGLNPDGSVCDAEGRLWNAQWGAGRVACYRPDGSFDHALEVPAPHTSCPAFGGPDLTTLFVTTARQGISEERLAREPGHGQTYVISGVARGIPESRVIL